MLYIIYIYTSSNKYENYTRIVTNLSNKHLLSRARGAGWWATVQQQKKSTIGIKKFSAHWSWKKNTICFKGSHREVKAECRQILGHMTLSGSVAGVLNGSWDRARLINSNQNSRMWIGEIQDGSIDNHCVCFLLWTHQNYK